LRDDRTGGGLTSHRQQRARLTREMFGDDRLIFSVDYPLSDNRQARDWFDRLDLTPEVREKIAHGTADNLLRLR